MSGSSSVAAMKKVVQQLRLEAGLNRVKVSGGGWPRGRGRRGGGGWDTAGELTRQPRLAPGKDAGSAAAISASFRAVAARVGAVVWGAG